RHPLENGAPRAGPGRLGLGLGGGRGRRDGLRDGRAGQRAHVRSSQRWDHLVLGLQPPGPARRRHERHARGAGPGGLAGVSRGWRGETDSPYSAPMSRKSTRAGKPAASRGQLGELGARTRVLQGAANVFAEVGVRSASVEDILKAAGISRRTFYKLYDSKESVMMALYRMGTDNLLGACTIAVGEGKTPLERIEGCIDAHLRSAREFGRLVFVLGGEAHRHESLLHARRMEVHE